MPPCATCPDPIIFTFATTLDVQYSTDGGKTFRNATAPATTRVGVRGSGQNGPVRYLDHELLSLDVAGGNLPAGAMIRESPTLASTGKHIIRDIEGGYMIGSFFDVFLELTVDGGQTWTPAQTPVHVDYCSPVAVNAYTTDTFPPMGSYNSPAGVPSRYRNGVVVRNFRHLIRPLPCPPLCPKDPPCLTCPPDFYDIATQLDADVSSDGGQTFQHVSVPLQTRVMVRHSEDTGDTRFFDTEMLSMMPPPTVPPGAAVKIRESPTLPSKGKTSVQNVSGGGFRIGSFFDVFTEISLDDGNTWYPVINPTHVELTPQAMAPALRF